MCLRGLGGSPRRDVKDPPERQGFQELMEKKVEGPKAATQRAANIQV